MKFSHSLQFNAVPEWKDYYVAYDSLKRFIFEKEQANVDAANTRQDTESSNQLQDQDDFDEVFLTLLDEQLHRVIDFYDSKQAELNFRLERLADQSVTCPDDANSPQSVRHAFRNTIEIEELEKPSRSSLTVPDTLHERRSYESRLSTQTSREFVEHLVDMRAELISLYVSYSELESFVELNRNAFDKILKKYDKVLNRDVRLAFMQTHVLPAYPFLTESVNHLRHQIARTERIYAEIFCDGRKRAAQAQMRIHLREQLTYGRNTVWKDMVSQERQQHAAHVVQAAHSTPKTWRVPWTSYHVDAMHVRQVTCLVLAVILFAILASLRIFDSTPQNHCFALLVLAAVLWATEAVPLYATGFLIPVLIVPLDIMRQEDGSTMPAPDAAKHVFESMFSSTIVMLLGGFALAGALSKYGIAKAFASHVLSRAGTRPRWVLLTTMFVSLFLSMWISNVATPVLCFSLVGPILRTLADNSPVAPCLLLGIALASCIGGMTSPISSPQNIITLQYMQPSPGWGIWFAVALPIAILSTFGAWALLLLVYMPDRACAHLNTIKPVKDRVSAQQAVVMLVTIVTIALWCAEDSMKDIFGSTGVIAAIPLFIFFGTGLLTKDDLHAFLWSVVILAQGGMALGAAVTSSGLLETIALHIKTTIQQFPTIAILAVFSLLILVVSTFVSHTVAALIIVPIVQEVGKNLPVPHANLLVMGAGLACSAGMGLPVSGYPNMSAIMLENEKGRQYLTTKDFVVTGVPVSIVVCVLIFTLGYGIMSLAGY